MSVIFEPFGLRLDILAVLDSLGVWWCFVESLERMGCIVGGHLCLIGE